MQFWVKFVIDSLSIIVISPGQNESSLRDICDIKGIKINTETKDGAHSHIECCCLGYHRRQTYLFSIKVIIIW